MAPVVDASPLIELFKQATAAQGVHFREGKKPDGVGSDPYVVGFFDAGRITDKSMRSRDGFEVYGSFQCAGIEPEHVRWVVVRLRSAVMSLFGASVGDRKVHLPSHEYPGPMTRDDDADPSLFIQIDEWRFRLS